MDIKNRLQFLHCDKLFTDSQSAKNWVTTQSIVEFPTLYGEPIVLKYGNESNPDIILAIGSVGIGKANTANKTYFIDTATLDRDIQAVSGVVSGISSSITEIKEAIKTIKKEAVFGFKDSKTISFTKVSNDNDESGKTYQADLIIKDETGDNANILCITNNGIYGSVNLTFDKSANKLNFYRTLTNGTIENKEIQLEAAKLLQKAYYDELTEEIVLIFTIAGKTETEEVRIPVRGLIEEWNVDNTNKTVTLTKEINSGVTVDKLSADVNLVGKGVGHNILEKVNSLNGYALQVVGTAENIYYDDNYNVQTKIKAFENKDTEILSALTEEISNRQKEDKQLQINIDNTNAKLNIVSSQCNNNTSGLANEIIRAKENETALSGITDIIKNNLNDEINRAVTSETKLKTDISNEQTRALNNENSISTELNSEIERARSEEDLLKGLVNKNLASIETIKINLSAETASRISSDNDEKTARIAGDEAEKAARMSADDDEKTARIAGDEKEKTDRIAADNIEVTNRINAIADEATQRTVADNEEKSNRIASDEAEKAARIFSDTQEQAARIAADENEQAARIAAINEEISNRQKADQAERDERVTADATEIANRIASDETEKQERIASDNTLKNNITAEQTRAENAEHALSDLIGTNIDGLIIKSIEPESEIISKTYVLQDKNGNIKGEKINVLKDQFLKSVTYDTGTKILTFVFTLSDGTDLTQNIDLTTLIDTYDGNNLILKNYVKGTDKGSIVNTDSANIAFGKVENRIDDISKSEITSVTADSSDKSIIFSIDTTTDNTVKIDGKIQLFKEEGIDNALELKKDNDNIGLFVSTDFGTWE